MTLARNIGLAAAAGGLIFALSSSAQAYRVSKWDCPTGQMKNPLTAICEGPYEGLFIFSSPAYGDSWNTGYAGSYWRNGHRYYYLNHNYHHR
jgi:hypothetical protein